MIHYRRILDVMGCENKRINEIKTLWGERLIDFHHRLLPVHAAGIELYDISSWHKFNGNSAKYYYPYYLAFFICNGILFENFITNEEEVFTRTIVIPAFEKASDFFGMKPLIVKIDEESEQCNKYWIAYPQQLSMEVTQSQALLMEGEK